MENVKKYLELVSQKAEGANNNDYEVSTLLS
jgi:hypothetical protein